MSVNAYAEVTGDAGHGAGSDSPVEVAVNRNGEASLASARLMEMAARDTDRWRAEARDEADALVADARREADRMLHDARAEAARLVKSARQEADQTLRSAEVEASKVREETTAVRQRHDADLARLRQLASDHRNKLRGHLSAMLERVESIPEGVES